MDITTPTETLAPTPASAWKGKVVVEGTDLRLPSENVARVKPLSPTDFLASGAIPDPLTAEITKAIQSKQGVPPSVLKSMTQDPKQLADALRMMDEVICEVVVEPSIQMPPKCVAVIEEDRLCDEYRTVDRHSDRKHRQYHPYLEGPRDPEVLYADNLDIDDKMFIFQWCLGGTRDLQTFREEQRASVEALSDGKDVGHKTKRAPRRK